MFYFEEINNKKILKSDLIKSSQVFFTTRESVVSENSLYELKETATKNLAEIAQYLEIKLDDILSPVQTHTSNIAVAQKGTNYPETDALIIDKQKVAILLNFADCTPIVLLDEEKNVGAIAHAGWRGTAGAITKKTVDFLKKNYKCEPKKLKALIGPAISLKNYQVDKKVFDKVSNTLNNAYSDYWQYDKKLDKFNIDLKIVNFHQLVESGLDIQRIDKCDYCTYDSNDIFFSYRRENGETARHSAILKLDTKN